MQHIDTGVLIESGRIVDMTNGRGHRVIDVRERTEQHVTFTSLPSGGVTRSSAKMESS